MRSRRVPLAATVWAAAAALCISVLGASLPALHETLPGSVVPEAPARSNDTSRHHDDDDQNDEAPEPIVT
jgi:hypothetical protein